MENGQVMSADGTQGILVLNALDQRDHGNDVMARRLKNRERQRRYRARKRLEADMKKTHVINHPTTLKVDMQMRGSSSDGIARVYCKRDWKKDARRGITSKRQEDAVNGFVKPLSLTSESQRTLPSENKAEVQAPVEWESRPSLSLVTCEANNTKLGRRNWKADARKKKS